MSDIRVYIVDDEDIVRDGLTQYVPWYDYGMEVVGTAENGMEAYDFICKHEVDLVISDIYMPRMDGLELVEKLKESGKSPVVILISGHSDFEYAKRAIKSKIVFEYILKPISFEELDKVLAAAKAKIINEELKSEFPILTKEEWAKLALDEKEDKISKQSIIINEINLCDLNHALRLFHESWNFMIKNAYSQNMIARYCIEMGIGLIELVLQERNSREILLEDPILAVNSKSDLADIHAYSEKLINTAYKVMSHKERMDVSPLISAALEYLNENYANHDQALNLLADKLNVSPNYLCLKFKEETGINYTKYLNSLRVKHAKELLRDIRLKVYMVSDMVGFDDTRYFSRIFRTYTGYTPTEFQKKEAIRS